MSMQLKKKKLKYIKIIKSKCLLKLLIAASVLWGKPIKILFDSNYIVCLWDCAETKEKYQPSAEADSNGSGKILPTYTRALCPAKLQEANRQSEIPLMCLTGFYIIMTVQ